MLNLHTFPRWDQIAKKMFWRVNLQLGIEHECSVRILKVIITLFYNLEFWAGGISTHLSQYILSNSATGSSPWTCPD